MHLAHAKVGHSTALGLRFAAYVSSARCCITALLTLYSPKYCYETLNVFCVFVHLLGLFRSCSTLAPGWRFASDYQAFLILLF
jgi:hypothetical protein